MDGETIQNRQEEDTLRLFVSLSKRVITGFVCAFTAYIFVISIKEINECFSSQVFSNVSFTLLCWLLGLTAAVHFLKNRVEKYHPANVYRFLWGMILLVQIVFLWIYSNNLPYADTMNVVGEAIGMVNRGDALVHSSGGYFNIYGNNYGLTIMFYYYFRMLKAIGITNYWLAAMVWNMVSIDGGIWFAVQTAKGMYSDRKANMLLLICLLNPVIYVFLPFTYTNTISLLFLSGIFYFAVYVSGETNRKKLFGSCVLAGIITGTGIVVRVTTLIGIIALILGGFFCTDKMNNRKNRRVLCCMLLIAAVVFCLWKAVINGHVDKAVMKDNFPAEHWIMMGLNGNGSYSSEDEAYTKGFESKEDKKKADMAVIKSRLQGHTADSMLQLLKNKIRITWVEDVDGLFIENAFYQDYSPFHKYLSGYKTDFLILYYRAFQLFLYVFAIIGLMEQMKNAGKPENDGMWLITLTICGFFLFYCIWEANVRYSITVVLLLSMEALNGWRTVENLEIEYPRYAVMEKRLGAVCLTMLLLLHIYEGVQNEEAYTQIPLEQTEYSIYTGVRAFNREIFSDVYSEKQCLEQTFTIDRNFNTINVFTGWSQKGAWSNSLPEENMYLFRLKDSSGNVLREETFGVELVDGYYKTFQFEEIEVNDRQQFCFEITYNPDYQKDAVDSMGFSCFELEDYDYVSGGAFYLNHQKTDQDMVFQVGMTTIGAYTTKRKYYLFWCAVLVLLLLIAGDMWKDGLKKRKLQQKTE